MWNFIYYFILHVYVHVQYLYYREKPYHINFSKALLALNLHIILREVTDKILHTVILFFFFYKKLISKSIATCGTSKPFNDNGWQLYEIRTHTVGLICILWTKSNCALYICACSLVSIFKSYFFYNIYLWKSLTLKRFWLTFKKPFQQPGQPATTRATTCVSELDSVLTHWVLSSL